MTDVKLGGTDPSNPGYPFIDYKEDGEFVTTLRLAAEGKLVLANMPMGDPATDKSVRRAWDRIQEFGYYPVPSECSEIDPFDPVKGRSFRKPGGPLAQVKAALPAFHQMLMFDCWNNAKQNLDFDLGVCFAVVVSGNHRGTFYGCKYGWRFLTEREDGND